ncbi:MAG TPA: hypothetical protein DIT13_11210 [Verrucomicrobiales bacterium]|nr:hypothetical protein [Verrucomicrobiales bacterium]HRJ07935.1 PD-(D/E)XK motif protein [Prosthecobacter sp.]HRK14446.1 PD-(D/E)XK motif protein [Prosthecobacter sp.]
MADILPAFASLTPSPHDGTAAVSYFALRIADSSRNYIAKTQQGHPVLVIETRLPVGAYPPSLKLENLTVFHGYAGTMNTPDGVVTGVFSIVECRVSDVALIESFLRLAGHLLNGLSELPEPRAVAIEVRKLVQIFQALRQPAVKSIQGLWAELFVLANSPDVPRWSLGWHTDPMERYDFAMQRLRVEVKSSANRVRRHHFSHEQLHPPSGIELWIASVFVERSSGGINCIELLREIQSELSADAAFAVEAKLLEALGSDFSKVQDNRFDAALAADSLSFVSVSAVPRMAEDLPDGVSELRYAVLIPQSASLQRQWPN